MQTTMNPTASSTGRVVHRDRERPFAERMGLPTTRQVQIDRAVRWALVVSSIGLLLIGINP